MIRPKSFKVSQIAAYLRELLEDDVLLSGFFIEGEISGLRKHSRGHIYFTIKDEGAALNAVIFKTQADELDFEPVDGHKVLIYGRLAHYEKGGLTQLIAEMMNPLGIGAAHQDLQELKQRLNAEGIFANRRPIPATPRLVAVVTSPTGAAVRDIITIMRRRNPLVEIVISPALVQGADAPASICEAIARANNCGADVIICGRGGGSAEDLRAFDNEAVARAVFASRIPVISAVGHETDVTLCDFAADLRAETPTAAAQIVCQSITELADDLNESMLQIREAFADRVAGAQASLDDRFLRFTSGIASKLNSAQAQLTQKAEILEKIAPHAVLERGFAAVLKDGRAVHTAAALKDRDEITIKFKDGDIKATVGAK